MEEAHAIDTGDFLADSGYLQIRQPATIEDKLSNAALPKEHTRIPVYVDSIEGGENASTELIQKGRLGCKVDMLASWNGSNCTNIFFRLYIIKDGMIAMKGGEGPMKYSVKEVGAWLENAQ